MNAIAKAVGCILLACAFIGGFYISSQRDAIFRDALNFAQSTATQTLGTRVTIGSAEVVNLSFSNFTDSHLVIRDIKIFDKTDTLLASVDTARVTFKLLSLYSDAAGAIDTINIDGAHLIVTKRADNSFNLTDIRLKSSGDSSFDAFVTIANASVTASFDDNTVTVDNISATANCADLSAVKATLTADTLGSHIVATGTLGANRQIVNANINAVDIAKVIPLIPAELIPDSVIINGGTASNIAVNVLNRPEGLSFSGSTSFTDAAVNVADTDITNITGFADFTDAAVIVNASATANGQSARANGTIRLDTDQPYFDIHATSSNFVPAAVVPNLGLIGAVDFNAHLIGTATDPTVTANVTSSRLAYENYTAENVSTRLKYQRNAVYLSNIRANAFGGSVAGEFEIAAASFAFNGHLRADSLNIDAVKSAVALDFPVSGTLFADVAVNGNVGDFSSVKVFGVASTSDFIVDNFPVNAARASFLFANNSITLDYLNVALPDNGTINLDGELSTTDLDLNFYGSHINLALAKVYNPVVDVGGLADFKGSISGSATNPAVNIILSAVDSANRGGFVGEIFNQPYDSLQLIAKGSLDNVVIDDFYLEKDGKVNWTVIDGVVNFLTRTVNIRLDTVDARVEDIVKVVAPDQEITGEVDNTVRVTGTIENPHVTGYVEFQYGSYRGFIVNSMRGDYYLEGDVLRLQDFVITSPMVDMVLNGTINRKTYDMDFVVLGRDVSLKRFQAKFPSDYPVEGHGTFEGLIRGNLDSPIFDGRLVSNSFTLNGVELKNIRGHLSMNGSQIALEDFEFNQGSGRYSTQLTANTATKSLNGTVEVRNADIPALAALANKKTKLITGRLNSTITVSGTIDNPAGTLRGEISNGALAGYDLHDVGVDINLLNNVVYVQKFAGKQGAAGEFSILGSAGLSGPVDLTAAARNLELAMIGAAAGLDAEFTGTTSLDAKIKGTADNPDGEILLTANGGIKGSTFDLMRAHIFMKDWIFDVKELVARRAIGDKIYQASAQGTIPIQALYIDSGKNLTASEQLNLKVSLDDADLSLLPVVSNQIAWAVGNMGGSVTITGTASEPQVNGAISLNNGSVKIKGMDSLIEHINIDTLFRGNTFRIENFTGNIGTGTFDVVGGFNFANYTPSDYNFTLTADNLDVRSVIFTGPINAEFSLNEVKFFNRSLPKISGNLDFDKCTFSIPTIPDSDEPLPDVLLDVTVNLGDKVHFYSSRLYNMFLTGSVKFEQSTTHPKTSGIISVKRGGTVNYIQTVFDIREGEAHFNQLDSFMPTLHFSADTAVANAKIFLAVNGTPGDAKVSLTSNPEMSETEIMQLLTMRDAYGNSTSNMTAADILALGLQMSILGDIEDTVRRTIGLDRFSVNTGSGSAFENNNYAAEDSQRTNDYDFNISVGKYIGDKVMLKYTQGINGDKVTRYGVQYDFNDNLGLTVEREENEYIFSLEARYKF